MLFRVLFHFKEFAICSAAMDVRPHWVKLKKHCTITMCHLAYWWQQLTVVTWLFHWLLRPQQEWVHLHPSSCWSPNCNKEIYVDINCILVPDGCIILYSLDLSQMNIVLDHFSQMRCSTGVNLIVNKTAKQVIPTCCYYPMTGYLNRNKQTSKNNNILECIHV